MKTMARRRFNDCQPVVLPHGLNKKGAFTENLAGKNCGFLRSAQATPLADVKEPLELGG
jgi:hypothetical protein